jgi:hypothetical protein
MLIPLMVAAAVGIVVYRDALTLERRGIRLGNAAAALWGVGTFAFTGIIGVMYLVIRFRALRATRSCPSCAGFARPSDQSCPSCGRPLHVGDDRLTEGQPRVADGS